MVSVERKPSTDDGRRPVGAPRRSGWGAQPLRPVGGQGRGGSEGEGRAAGEAIDGPICAAIPTRANLSRLLPSWGGEGAFKAPGSPYRRVIPCPSPSVPFSPTTRILSHPGVVWLTLPTSMIPYSIRLVCGPAGWLTRCLSFWAGLNTTTRRAEIGTSSPVLGLRPMRVFL